ncbi:uncharacterized protein LOC143882949 [Tasmannia lanceolata]|uniref:uncharacterized protein LOC143882949 n=1 Tax=Tasmannia lanceolata TaxID=3420 RepID=UPI004063EB29
MDVVYARYGILCLDVYAQYGLYDCVDVALDGLVDIVVVMSSCSSHPVFIFDAHSQGKLSLANVCPMTRKPLHNATCKLERLSYRSEHILAQSYSLAEGFPPDVGVYLELVVLSSSSQEGDMSKGTRGQEAKKMEAELARIRDSSAKHEEGLKEIKNLIAAMDLKYQTQYDQLASSISINRPEHQGSSHNTPSCAAFSDGPVETKFSRVEFPMFDGVDPLGWFFDYNQILEEQKVPLASIHKEKKALQWFRWLERSQGRWDELVAALCTRFGPNALEDFTGALTNLQQETTVKDYQEQFEELAARTKGLRDEFFISCFTSGLKEEIRSVVQLFKPSTISQASGMARLQEENAEAMSRRSRAAHVRSEQPKATPATKLGPMLSNSKSPSTFKRLTQTEMNERQSKGLCFNCDEGYTPGHQCKKKQLFLIEMRESDDEVEELSDEGETVGDCMQISVHALTGTLAPRTMRIRGYIKRRPIVILIDSRSTRNFVDPQLAKRTGCNIQQTPRLQVTVANGNRLLSDAVCRDFRWLMQGFEFSTEARLLPLRGYDVVLGIQWLTTLGDIVWNFANLRMEFCVDGRRHVLRGGTSGELHVDRNKMEKILKKEGQGALAELFVVSAVEETVDDPDLAKLSEEFSSLFNDPTNYLQNVLMTTKSRYYHKNEIERLVQEMLQSGIVQPSTSPFSSLVLLVTKKDNSWRFCVDYTAVNRATVKDNFPIPAIDELLDELYGAEFFTKIGSSHRLFVKQSKCSFRQTKLEYLEHIISRDGVTTDPAKIENMLHWPKPHSIKALRGFLGLTGYYRRFVRDYGKISKPLTDMLKKDAFH